MNVEWARLELERFLSLAGRDHEASLNRIRTGDLFLNAGPSDRELQEAAVVVEQVLNLVIPDWRPANISKYDGWNTLARACARAVALLSRADEIRAYLGDSSPAIQASALHPWIWDAARSLWQSGHYRQAVAQAAIKVNTELQNKVQRRDISEGDLFVQAFSNDPPKAGAPRLRHPEDVDSKTDQSVRRGTRAFAEGCYAALRNPVSHVEGDLSETEALEQLAAFSILERWVQRAEVQTV